MDEHSRPEPECTYSITCDVESPSHASGMFSNSQHFTVTGGTFTNVTKNYAATPSHPSDLQMIPLADIDLRHEIRLDNSTVVIDHRRKQACVRRLYSAKVEGRKSNLTVAMYQGDDAEQEAFNYLYSAFQREFFASDCTLWIRPSTGRLCTELTPASDSLWLDEEPPEAAALSGIYGLNADAETISRFIDSLTLEQYHYICDWNLRQYRHIAISASTTVNLGAVFHYSGNLLKESMEIAFLPSTEAPTLCNWTIFGGSTRQVMPNGWTRFQSGEVFNNTLFISLYILGNADDHPWLSQANHIFRSLNITSNFEDYVLPCSIQFQLNFLETAGDPPEAFLFLCPREYFRTSSLSFRFPACPAYWSLDPSGIDRLSPEEATALGFTSFELATKVEGWAWDASIYEGLRQFHEAKGFDPCNQDVARHLGYPPYQVSPQGDAFAYEDDDFDADLDSDCESAYPNGYESECGPNSACDDSDADAESSHSEADVRDPAGANCGSEHTDISDCEGHDASESTSGAAPAYEISTIQKDIPEPTLSWSFKCLMVTQLALILFLALSWVYAHISVSFSLVL
ncbi:hypothetical protein MSAN_00120400 [Mycena sanguinolenta]|uniref:Uncharacterized protein n=1 Tax=Mycena sanguinolenta TaxID=230812 RepID=A0A8H7DLS2_9AGAR|nr:hypothetical protein MSAN_00120400 [Mycena sanguinolenta]